ncbi:MAG: MmgE/PrpD family protein [Lachnospiraceae bacterium]|nr:MmgE/PrpD family protein [Lachnospiraceae bacterium]
MNRSIDFVKSIDEVWQRPVPDAVLARARQSLLDYLAVASAGAAFQADKLEKYVEFAEPEEGRYTAVGMGRRLALKEAVFLNGLNGHALDFDDGTNSGIIHLGSPIFSLLLPLAQRRGLGTEEVLRAAVAGYEASYTMAVSIQPGHKARGYHATGTCGVIGASLAAAYLLGFTGEERFQAFAAACVSASGMLKVLDDGSELKPYNVAKSALLALTSLELAKAGFRGHPDPLGGNRGYFKMMTGKEEVELKPLLWNGTYAVMKTYTKPYASCRYTHPPVEAAIRLHNAGIKAEDVERIDIATYSLAVGGHDHTEIPGAYSAKMSTPYSTAAALIYGKAGLQEFEEAVVTDPTVLELTKKVHVEPDEEFSRTFPTEQTAVLTLTTVDGRVLQERVDFPKGEPENPMDEQEFYSRYAELMRFGGADEEKIDALYRMVKEETVSAGTLAAQL